jgi:hypothetical protein
MIMNQVVYYGLRAWVWLCGPCARKKNNYDVPPETHWSYGKVFDIQTIEYSNGRTKRVVYPASAQSHKDRADIGFTPPYPSPPWFFIGCYDSAESLQDRTCEMDDYVYPGNVITLALLQHLFPGTQRWVYIHPETFEETDFPSEGIVIEQDE